MLLAIFSPIQKRLSKLLKYQDIKTDNALFRLHCILTVAVLVGSSVLLTTHQLVGKPISCITSLSEGLKEWNKPITTWCWVSTTFTMPSDIKKQILVGKNMAYPGVFNEFDSERPKKYYTYYQWVCFVLFLQAIMCFIPKLMWGMFEGGLVTKLAVGLQGVCQKEDLEKRTDNIICYLQTHTKYAMFYWFCEGLCLLNLLLQMWLMNVFLGGYFFSSGFEVLKNTETAQYERNDPLIYIFPRITKCEFNYYGPSGNIVNMDNLCVLPQNIINEKVYIILWFWYNVLTVMFSIVLIYRILLVRMPSLRARMLVARTRCVSLADAKSVTAMLDLGDWWLIYMLSKNIDPLAYRDLISDFMKREKKMAAFV